LRLIRGCGFPTEVRSDNSAPGQLPEIIHPSPKSSTRNHLSREAPLTAPVALTREPALISEGPVPPVNSIPNMISVIIPLARLFPTAPTETRPQMKK